MRADVFAPLDAQPQLLQAHKVLRQVGAAVGKVGLGQPQHYHIGTHGLVQQRINAWRHILDALGVRSERDDDPFVTRGAVDAFHVVGARFEGAAGQFHAVACHFAIQVADLFCALLLDGFHFVQRGLDLGMGSSQFLFMLGGGRLGLLAQGLVLNFEGRNGRIAVCQFLRQVLQLCRCLFEGRVGLRERLLRVGGVFLQSACEGI